MQRMKIKNTKTVLEPSFESCSMLKSKVEYDTKCLERNGPPSNSYKNVSSSHVFIENSTSKKKDNFSLSKF